MPSAQQKKRAEKKKQAEKERMAKLNNKKNDNAEDEEVNKLAEEVEDVDLASLNARGTAGVLASHSLSADIHIHNFSMTFHGKVCLLENYHIKFVFDP